MASTWASLSLTPVHLSLKSFDFAEPAFAFGLDDLDLRSFEALKLHLQKSQYQPGFDFLDYTPFHRRACEHFREWGGDIGGACNTANKLECSTKLPAKVSVPDSLSSLLRHFRFCFTAPGYEVFSSDLVGFVLRPVERTVCGMLTGAGLAGG